MQLVANTKVVVRDAIGTTSALATTGNGVNMKGYSRCRITLLLACSDAAVGGGVVTLKQGSSSTVNTALSFTEMFKNEDVLASTGDALTRTAVSSDTFNAGIRNKTSMYQIEVRADMLDTDTYGSENTWVRLNMTAVSTATGTATLVYELYEPKQATGPENLLTACA